MAADPRLGTGTEVSGTTRSATTSSFSRCSSTRFMRIAGSVHVMLGLRLRPEDDFATATGIAIGQTISEFSYIAQ
jgi:hypothetical protein